MMRPSSSRPLRHALAQPSALRPLPRTSRSLHSTCYRLNGHRASLEGSSTVNADEIAHFSRLSSLWWDETGEFGMLHKMNPVRMQFIKEKLLEIRREETDDDVEEGTVLRGLDVLDVGCGGGLLSESLARMGATTLGIDASESNIAIASLHASADPSLDITSAALSASSSHLYPGVKGKGRLVYENTSVENLLARRGPASFDVVCFMEVLEHVDNPRAFLDSCAQLVKPGGHLFLSTIARNPLSYFLTIFTAEKLLRFVEPGTHTYSKYVNPSEIISYFQTYRSPLSTAVRSAGTPWIGRVANGVPARVEAETRGIIYVPWNGEWRLSPRGEGWSEWCNYLFWVRRPKE
ncbi:ubiquinone biosynthesis O-methyltransferase [Cristinia sonorae]|uniref:Ubiquinone biosynthesis O-methyltransferase, mitochondrial n=1 Tax=Cristinia sonorae TaxID=1940300 RepID=A0A8K0UJU7_9AGAR|nr:ubiquinone biosynthesis O-methyltransferase [Cristinia sonorae]